mgnify:CR=1 FL=1
MSNEKSLLAVFSDLEPAADAIDSLEGGAKLEALIARVVQQQRSVRSLKADFVQRKRSELLLADLESSGVFIFRAPDKVRWDYRQPDQMVVVFADDTLTTFHPEQARAEQVKVSDSQRRFVRVLAGTQPLDDLIVHFSVTLADPGAWAGMHSMGRFGTAVFDNVCSCVRRSVWSEHRFPASPIAEDLAWGREVVLAGYRLVYVPSAAVVHSHERSARYELGRTLFDLGRAEDRRDLPGGGRGHPRGGGGAGACRSDRARALPLPVLGRDRPPPGDRSGLPAPRSGGRPAGRPPPAHPVHDGGRGR